MSERDQQLELTWQGCAVQPTRRVGPTVYDLFRRWEQLRRFTKSWKAEADRFAHIVRLLGDRPADAIDETAWAGYVAARIAEGKKPPSAATLYLELVRAKQLLRWAARAKLIARNGLDGVRAQQEPRKRETWLTWEQVERLLRAAEGNVYLHAWILVAVTTGMRISETLTLRHDRIGGDGVVTIGSSQTKSGKKRIVALPSRALEAINALPRHVSSVYVFASGESGRPVHRTTVSRWFRATVESARLDGLAADGDFRLRCHDMRHTCASLLDDAGAAPTAIRDQLGHAKLATTERYLHRHQADRAMAMANLMDRKPAKKVSQTSNETLTVKRSRGFS